MLDNSEKELFESFLSESAELVSELERDVITLEKDPSDRQVIDNIFRCVHSLKGNSGLFGLAGIKLFTHTMESLIGRIREGEMETGTELISIILKGTDVIKDMFERLSKDMNSTSLSPEEEKLVEKMTSILESAGSIEEEDERLRVEMLKFTGRPDIQEEMSKNAALMELCEIIKKNAPHLTTDKRDTGKEVFYEGLDVSREYNAIQTVIDEVNQGIVDDKHARIVFDNLEYLIKKHEDNEKTEPVQLLKNLNSDLEMMHHEETGFDEVLAGITEESLKEYEQKLTAKKETPKKSTLDNGSLEKTGTVFGRQIKVDQRKLDQSISTAGELVTISEYFNYLQTEFNEGNIETNLGSLKDAITSLQEISGTLSRDLYDIRKVPVKEALEKLPRLLRDIQVSVGKKARLLIEGGDNLVDKGMIPKLETILVHMIRNSLDHGIEKPEERKAAGKPEEGTVSLNIRSDGSTIFINIEDDGKGLDIEKIRQKVIEKGLASPEEVESFSDDEMAEKIFLPGFSTADEVTETSGRGVGMDTVNSYIQEMGGSSRLKNRPGKGVSVNLSIPLTHTTLVKKGLAISVGNNVFLVPIESVVESFRPEPSEISTVEGKEEIIQRRGEIMSLIRLHRFFNIKTKITRPEEALLVTVHHKKRKICFMADNILGQRQIIYKDLTIKTTRQPSPFEGVSVYDGSRLAMILDIVGIMDQVTQ